jgi:hypothetical protein
MPKEYYVNEGAKLKCPWGSEQPKLDVVHIGDPVYLCDELMANIADNKPMANIKPFGKCSSLANPAVAAATSANYGRLQKMPCIPVTPSPWLGGKMDLIINGSPALLSTCKCACSWSSGRLIEVADPGQDSVYVDGPMTITVTEPTPATQQSLMANGLRPSQGTAGIMASGFQSSQDGAKSSSQASQNAGTVATTGKTFIKEVRGVAEADIGQKIKYEAVYNKKESELSDEDKKKKIRWTIKVDGGGIIELVDTGKEITLEMKNEWAGKIAVMACIEGFNEKVNCETRIKKEDPLTLHFNGKFLLLRVVEKDKILRFNYKAVSGRPLKDGSFDYSKERQAIKNQGPIPEGEYHINPQEIQYTADRSTYDKFKGIFGGGTFKGGTVTWGIGRVWIYPQQVTVKGIIRDNFSIHGGAEPGSAGCIDLTSNDKDFFDRLTQYRGDIKKIPLTVKY